MRALPLLGVLSLVPGPARAQASVASDLWRVADGTQVVPLSLADGGSAPLWTPAVALASGERLRVGAEAVNSPSDIGVSGGLFGLTARVGPLGFVSAGYARLSVGDVAYTETSPEALGTVPIYNQALSLGVSRVLGGGVTGGLALRYLSGELGPVSRGQLGVDFGAAYGSAHWRLGAATRFFDPTLRAAAAAASFNLGAEYRSPAFDAWGTRAQVRLRYGLTSERGEAAQQLATAGLALGSALALDGGVSREEASGDVVWRSRLAVGAASGPIRIQIGRDGGVNGFGATYRFGLTVVLR